MVRLYRTFSNRIFTRGSRCVVYLYTCSRWFNHSEPPRTFSNHFSAEKARCALVYHEFGVVRLYRTFSNHSSKWFDYAEPFRTTYPQGDQSVYGTYTLVPGGPTAANLLEPSRPLVKVWFEKVRYSRTTSNACDRPLHTLLPLYRSGL